MEMLVDFDIMQDDYAPDLLWEGWFNPDATPDDRADARELFLDYMDWDVGDFDWDSWREWYEAA